MIAARFRLVGWVAGVAGAALVCYMASQSVAAERSALAKVDTQISDTKSDIARLETEITARSRAGQVERWNGVLALQAARPAQYVQSGIQLASMAGGKPLPLDPQITSQSAVQMAAYHPAAPAQPDQAPVPAAAVAPQGVLRHATFVQPKQDRLASDGAPVLIKASYEKPAPTPAIDQLFAPVDSKPAKPAKAAEPKHDKTADAKAIKPGKDASVAKADAKPAKAEATKPVKAMAKIAAAIDPRPAHAKAAEVKLAEATPAKPKPKAAAKHDDSLLPADFGKLIAAEIKPKSHKGAL